MAAPHSDTVTVDGRRLHYLEWGARHLPTVLVLHGFTGHAWQAERLAGRLTDHRVLALDQRGHGDSAHADVYGSVPMVADAVAFLDALDVEDVALVGHSLGGIVGTALAALHPERVRALVLGDIGPEIAAEGRERIQRNVAERDVFASVDDAFAAQRALNPTADLAALRHRVEHNLVPRDDGMLTWKFDPRLRDGSARFENHRPDEQWAFLAALSIPVLILRGGSSDVLSEDVAQRMLAANPRATLVTIPGAGHSIATDAPDLVAAAIADFLATAAADGGLRRPGRSRPGS